MEEGRTKHFLFVGLGNPGKKYEMTRHNMGYLVIQAFAHLYGISLKEEKRFQARMGKGKVKGADVHLLLPTTYMNESGQAVRRAMDYFKLTPEELVVVTDDIALPYGELRLRSQGSAGGHNGLKSVQKHIGTTQYARLRMGIERKGERRGNLVDYVLDAFNKKEAEQLAPILDKGAKALEMLLTEEVANVMNKVNKKITTPEKREENNNE